MGFYGNIVDVEKNSSFIFDKIYANRRQMEENASSDGVYVGRYVLIEYDTDYSNKDYKKVFKNDKITSYTDQKVFPLFSTSEYSTKIFYDSTQIIVKGDIVLTINNGTIVYSTIKDINNYYICVGYYYLNEDEETCTMVIGKESYSIIPGKNDIPLAAGVKYALFKNFDGIISGNTYTDNYQIDIEYAKERGYQLTGHGWDSTVWQKTYVNDVLKYVMIAELNTVIPTFDITADAPTQTPVPPHFDNASTDVYYNLHWQPQWGMRVQLAGAQHSQGKKVDLSDENTTWIREIYNKDTQETTCYYYSIENKWVKFNPIKEDVKEIQNAQLPAAIYYNEAGFDSNKRYVSTLDNQLNILPTGKSQTPYGDNQTWSDTLYNSHIPGVTKSAVDTQEISMILPGIGNAVSQMWDIVYGKGIGAAAGKNDVSSIRATDVEWRDTPADGDDPNRLQLIHTTEKNGTYSYEKNEVETLAGSINSVHDLMGMIIKEDLNEDFDAKEADVDSIYLLKDLKFYRKVEDINESLVEVDYRFDEATDLAKEKFDKNTFYDSNHNAYTGDYNSSSTYYRKFVDFELTGPFEVTTFGAIMQDTGNDYLTKNANGDYIYDTNYKNNQIYYTINSAQCKKVSLKTDYEPDKFYYKINDDYYLDTALKLATQEIEYTISEKIAKVDARKIYRPSTYFYKTQEIQDNSDLYMLNTSGYDEKVKNYIVSRPISKVETEAAWSSSNSILTYPRRIKEARTYGSNNYPVFEYIYPDGKNYSLVYKVSNSEYRLVNTEEKITIDSKGKLQESYNYILEQPVQYIKYNGSIDNIGYDSNGYPYFYGIVPSDANYETTNEIYVLTQLNDLIDDLDSVNYYKLIDKNYYLAKNVEDLPSYTDTGEIVYYFLPTFSKYSSTPFYQNNKYYYQGIDKKSWYKDRAGVPIEGREYYSISESAIVKVNIDGIVKSKNIYEPGKYYLKLSEHRYVLDYSTEPKEGKVYYTGVNDFYVLYDPENILPRGAYWNVSMPIRHGLQIAQLNTAKTYVMKELVGFARTLNTIHGLILLINNFLDYGNTDTRNTATVLGSLNKLNDIIAKFEILDYAQYIVTDSYGRLHTAPAVTDEWITSYVDPDVNSPKVHIHHNTQNIEVSNKSNTDLNNPAKDTITLQDILTDNAGHVTANQKHVYILPYGFKTVNADSGSYTAKNTQDSFSIKTSDNWLSTKIITNSEVSIVHDNAQTVVNTKGPSAAVSPKFGSSFVIPQIGIDSKGHTALLKEFSLTLPKPSYTIDSTGNVITSISLVPETGAFTETKEFVGNLALGAYIAQTKKTDITKNDTVAIAISKNAYAIDLEVTDRGTAIENVTTAYKDADATVTKNYQAADSEVTKAYLAADSEIIKNYQAADTSLDGKITIEVTNRTNAISSLKTELTNNINSVASTAADNLSSAKTELEGKISTNKTNYEAADTALSGRIGTLEKLDISTKINSYDSSIGTLQSDVQSLKDLNLSAEIASLKKEIASLKQRIAALETTTE